MPTHTYAYNIPIYRIQVRYVRSIPCRRPLLLCFLASVKFARLSSSQRTKRQKNAFVIYVPTPSAAESLLLSYSPGPHSASDEGVGRGKVKKTFRSVQTKEWEKYAHVVWMANTEDWMLRIGEMKPRTLKNIYHICHIYHNTPVYRGSRCDRWCDRCDRLTRFDSSWNRLTRPEIGWHALFNISHAVFWDFRPFRNNNCT